MPKYTVAKGQVTVRRNVTLEMSEAEAKRHGDKLVRISPKVVKKSAKKAS